MILQEDLDFFQEKIGDLNSGFGFEYNQFCIEQGILIAKALRTKEKILEFFKKDAENIKKSVPGFSDDHSGNTYSLSFRFAIIYLEKLKVDERDQKINKIIE